MLTSSLKWLEPDLMDVVRLFRGAEELEIAHEFDAVGFSHINKFRIGASERGFEAIPDADESIFLPWRALVKRYAKLALYDLLSEMFDMTLPWGSLTGIRPTALAYKQLKISGEFEKTFGKLRVSEENIALVKRVLEAQKPYYRPFAGTDLFISLPFCPTKCEYCSFITAPIAGTKKYMPAYLDALEKELSAAEELCGNLRSVYIGGGTPFVLEEEELERVLQMTSPLLKGDPEYTVEAGRPDTFTEKKLELCKTYGVTRICINAQSFSDKTLRAIGRKHTAEDVYRAFKMASPYGFDINCDLIAGLTGESVEEFEGSVDAAISLSPANITVHTLCLKKGARLKEELLYRGENADPHARLREEGIAEMIDYSREKLLGAGYVPYYLYRQKYMAGAHENVGWTKPNRACIYNIDVMEEIGDNLAVGANAISKKLFHGERIERLAAPKDIPTYLSKVDTVIEEKRKLFNGEV